MMKNYLLKICSLILAVMMIFGMSMIVSATEYTGMTLGDQDQDFYYQVTKVEEYRDYSRVDFEWHVPTLQYNYMNLVAWDNETLKWSKTHKVSNDSDFSFMVVNRSSYPIKAFVEFTAEDILNDDDYEISYLDELEEDTNNVVIESIVGSDHQLKTLSTATHDDKLEYLADYCTETIKGKITADLSDVEANSGVIGHYTLSFRATEHEVTMIYYKDGERIEIAYMIKDGNTLVVDDATRAYTISTGDIVADESYTDEIGDVWNFTGWSQTGAITIDADMEITANYEIAGD